MPRIALLKQSTHKTSLEHYLAGELQKAFSALEVETKTFVLANPMALFELLRFGPSCSLSFDTLVIEEEQMSLADWVQAPLAQWVRGSWLRALPTLNSKYGCLLVKDPRLATALKQPFLPDAVGEGLIAETNKKRSYEVVIFADLVDKEVITASWKERFDSESYEWLQANVDTNLFLPSLLGEVDELLLQEIESYQRAKRSERLVSTFGSFNLHLFGNHQGKNWYPRLNNPNVHLHPLLPLHMAFRVLKNTKILIIDPYFASLGGDFWFLHALALGAFPLTTKNSPWEERIEGPFYTSWETTRGLTDRVEELLQNEPLREEAVLMAQGAIKRENFTVRARTILRELNLD